MVMTSHANCLLLFHQSAVGTKFLNPLYWYCRIPITQLKKNKFEREMFQNANQSSLTLPSLSFRSRADIERGSLQKLPALPGVIILCDQERHERLSELIVFVR